MAKLKEIIYEGVSGFIVAPILILAALVAAYLAAKAVQNGAPGGVLFCALLGFCILLSLKGFNIVELNEAKVFTLFGRYCGSYKEPGFIWVNPFFASGWISLKVSNYETERLKVNDSHGNPIEIAAIVVWKVQDSAEAYFNVEDYEAFMKVQSESALRELASKHPYDKHEKGVLALRSDSDRIATVLRSEIQQRLEQAGIEIIEARLSHLAYAPEIAGAMLKVQQATAIIAARQQLVEGAVTMVDMALRQISKKKMARLNTQEKARLVSNLLLVLCGDKEASPVISVGSTGKQA